VYILISFEKFLCGVGHRPGQSTRKGCGISLSNCKHLVTAEEQIGDLLEPGGVKTITIPLNKDAKSPADPANVGAIRSACSIVRRMQDLFSDYPGKVRAGTHSADASYERKTDYYAEHGRQPDASAPGAALFLNGGAIAVFQGKPAKDAVQPAALSPVYELYPGGSPAVPTGLVFLRFREGVDVASRQQEIKRAGYEVAQSPPFASNAAWLRARSGKIADALTGIPKLEALPDVENVEPQMLMESTTRK
jgi:hypothetical protein